MRPRSPGRSRPGVSAGERLRGGGGRAQARAAVLGGGGRRRRQAQDHRARARLSRQHAARAVGLGARSTTRRSSATGWCDVVRVPAPYAYRCECGGRDRSARPAAATRSRTRSCGRARTRSPPSSPSRWAARPPGPRCRAPDYWRTGPRDLRPARRALRRRRGAHRRRPDRHLVGAGAVRRRARHHDAGQGNRRRLRAALGGRGAAAHRGRAGAGLGRAAARPDLLASSGRSAPPAWRRCGICASTRWSSAAPRWAGVLHSRAGGAARASAAWATCAAAGCSPASSSWPTRRAASAVPARGASSPRRSPTRRCEAGLVVWPNVGPRRRRQRRPGDAGAAVHRSPRTRSTRSCSCFEPRAERHASTRTRSASHDRRASQDHLHLRQRRPGRVPPPVRRGARRASARRRARAIPFYIGGEPVRARRRAARRPFADRHSLVLGTLRRRRARRRWTARSTAARAAQRGWARLPWRERVAILRRAAALIRERKYELAALMSLEVGKSRLEAMGDAEESADLIDYYCGQVEDADGFVRPMARITPVERNTDVLRPYGVFACIAPFNFPLALSAGMSSAALVAGQRGGVQAGRGHAVDRAQAVRDLPRRRAAGGRVQLPVGPRRGDRRRALAAPRRGRRGVHRLQGGGHADPRTGSARAGSSPACWSWAARTRRSCMPSADLDAAAEGVMRSAFSLQNQKCSATSRVYVDRAVRRAVHRAAAREDPRRSGWAIPPSATCSSAR